MVFCRLGDGFSKTPGHAPKAVFRPQKLYLKGGTLLIQNEKAVIVPVRFLDRTEQFAAKKKATEEDCSPSVAFLLD